MTGWQPVVLWTDGLAWLGVVLMLTLLFAGRASMHDGWRRLWQSPIAVISMVLLLCYASIGLLDSLHYRVRLPQVNGHAEYSVTIYSVLDRLLAPLRDHKETSYAAPLARHAFSATPQRSANGTIVEIHQPLALGGKEPARAKLNFAVQGAIRGGMAGLILLVIIFVATLAIKTLRAPATPAHADCSHAHFPWRSFSATVLSLSMIVGSIMTLSAHFHVMGTNEIGQDVLYDSIKSIRTGLMMGCLATLVTLPLAVGLGLAAGYFGGWVDDLVQYIYTTLNAIPSILLIAAAVLLMQGFIETHPALFDSTATRSDIRLLFLCIILGMTNWTGLCRILRGETLKLRELDYIQAAHSFGVPSGRILWRHVLPNLSHLILISLVMDFSGLVLAEAVLSYIGVGVDPTMHSWGNMINAARLELSREPVIWWPLTSAFVWMFTLVLAANLFADAVREAFDPMTTR